MVLAVPERRATVQHRAEGLELEIPPERSILSIAALPVWLVIWGFGEAAVIGKLFHDGKFEIQPFLLVWLLVWTIGGCTAMYSLIAQLIGKEIVTLSHSTLTIRRRVAGFGRANEYDLGNVRNLRVVSRPDGFPARRNQVSPFSAGTIAFDYGAKTYRFAAGVDEAEASMIVSDLKSYHPF